MLPRAGSGRWLPPLLSSLLSVGAIPRRVAYRKSLGASPVLAGWLAPLDLVVVVAVLDHLALPSKRSTVTAANRSSWPCRSDTHVAWPAAGAHGSGGRYRDLANPCR
jgi:hypothetical protein